MIQIVIKPILAFALLVLIISPEVFAQRVSRDDARTVASNFYSAKTGNRQQIVPDAEKVLYSGDEAEIILYSFSQGGFVAISLWQGVSPVVAYSLQGMHDFNNMPENASVWYEASARYISILSENNLINREVQLEWEELLSGQWTANAAKSVILLSTEWGQGCYYNTLCPTDVNGPCGHTVTGCVATSMAMIMKYWNYPQHGTGSNSYQSTFYGVLSADFGNTEYQWDEMPNLLTTENNAIATLMYHCGVAVEMQYTATSSGAGPGPSNFTEYFAYSPNASMVYKSDFTDAEWIALIKSEINNNRPVQYVGDSDVIPEGHAWVCDGYDENDYLHFNWGWDNLGGYYALGTGMFPLDNYATVKIMPVVTCDVQISELLSPVSQTFTEPQVITVRVNNFSFDPLSNIPVSYQINSGTVVTETINETIDPMSSLVFAFEQTADFSQNPGSVYHVRVFSSLPCDLYHDNDTLNADIENVVCSEMPFSMGFSVDESRTGWFFEDVNNDGTTWQITPANPVYQSHSAFYQGNSNQADDWIFTKCLELDENKVYKLSFDYASLGMYWPQNLEVYIGDAPASDNMYLFLDSILNFNNNVAATREIYFTVENHEHHYIGFRCFSNPEMLVLSLDNIHIAEMSEPDIALVSIDFPIETCNMGDETLRITLRNLSSVTLADIPVEFQLNDDDPVTETIAETIAPGETYVYQFQHSLPMSSFGEYALRVYPSLANDANTGNDTIISIYHNYEAATIPFAVGFSSADELAGYTIENSNNDNRFWNYYSGSGHDNPGCMRYEYNDFNAADDWFFTRCIYLEPDYDYTLTFYHRIESSQWPESMEVKLGTGAASGLMTGLLLDLPVLSNENWQQAEAGFIVDAAGFYYIGFHCNSAAQMFNMYLDDIALDGEYILSPVSEMSPLHIYPNPVADELHVKTGNSLPFLLTITDLNGRVLTKNRYAGPLVTIPCRHLDAGVYMILIENDERIYRNKLVVE